MRRALSLTILILCVCASIAAQTSEPAPSAPSSASTLPPASATALQAARASFAKLPLAFEKNVGQTDGRVKYTSRGPGYSLFLTADEAVFVLRGGGSSAECAKLAETSSVNCDGALQHGSQEFPL